MASGDTLAEWTANGYEPPAAGYGTFAIVNDQPVLTFDASTQELVYVADVLSSAYSGGGVTLTVIWTSASATSGDCFWAAEIERQAVGHDILTDSFAGSQTVVATAPSAAGDLVYSTISFTHGAQMDSLAVDERFRVSLWRSAAHGSDTMAGDARLVHLLLTET